MKKKRVLFISSTGGHLSEMMKLSSCFDRYEYYIVTEKTKSNLSLSSLKPSSLFMARESV